MVSGGPPDRLNGKHILMAIMYAAGWDQRRIAKEMGYAEMRVSSICSSALFKAEVRRLQGELAKSTVLQVVERIALESNKTLDTVLELRDHAETESVRLGAAFGLMDRDPATAKRVKTEEERTLRIVLGGDEIRRIMDVTAEMDGKPVPALAPGEPTIRARTLEEALEAFKEPDA